MPSNDIPIDLMNLIESHNFIYGNKALGLLKHLRLSPQVSGLSENQVGVFCQKHNDKSLAWSMKDLTPLDYLA